MHLERASHRKVRWKRDFKSLGVVVFKEKSAIETPLGVRLYEVE